MLSWSGPARTAILALLILGAQRASGQVACSDPNNLCTGDPCVIPALEVASPCIVDFGARAVIVDGGLRMPAFGELSFTAASIEVRGPILSRSPVGGSGDTSLELVATGDITVDGRLKMLGSATGTTSISLQAGNDLLVRQPVRAVGVLQVTFAAGGDITLEKTVQATRKACCQTGAVTMDAGGLLTVAGKVRAPNQDVFLRGAMGVVVERSVLNTGDGLNGQRTIEISSSMGGVDIRDRIFAIVLHSSGGGFVTVNALNDVVLDAAIFGNGGTSGDTIMISSGAGAVTLNDFVLARCHHDDGCDGGSVEVNAAGAVTVNASILADADIPELANGGLVRLVGAEVSVVSGVTLNVGASTNGGELRFQATAGDLDLGGTFIARAYRPTGTGGIIEGSATGNVTASGNFQAAPTGCIAFTAGGTLNTSGGSFDTTLSADCPGS